MRVIKTKLHHEDPFNSTGKFKYHPDPIVSTGGG